MRLPAGVRGRLKEWDFGGLSPGPVWDDGEGAVEIRGSRGPLYRVTWTWIAGSGPESSIWFDFSNFTQVPISISYSICILAG